VTFSKKGAAVLMVRAGNNQGEVQPATADWNPAGYRRHVVESTPVIIA
jgi:sulfite dehydrogenase